MQHITMELENQSLKLINTDRYSFPETLARIRRKLEKSGQEVIYYSECFNSIYMDLVGYETCDKLICTYGEGCRNKNTISKHGIP